MKHISPFMRFSAITIMAVSLSGCSSLNSFGNSLWSGTSHMASKSYNSVASLFRAAPARDEGGLYVGSDATLNTALLSRHVSQYASLQPYTPMLGAAKQRVLPVQTTPQLRGSHSMTCSDKGAAKRALLKKNADTKYQTASLTPTLSGPISTSRPTPVPIASPKETDSLSYVRLKGGVSMADFESCAQSSGGYFEQTRTGYRPNTGFDRCMRAKGYISEAEAETRLANYEDAMPAQVGFAP